MSIYTPEITVIIHDFAEYLMAATGTDSEMFKEDEEFCGNVEKIYRLGRKDGAEATKKTVSDWIQHWQIDECMRRKSGG